MIGDIDCFHSVLTLVAVESALPVALLEPYTALEVQRTTSLSLVHLEVKKQRYLHTHTVFATCQDLTLYYCFPVSKEKGIGMLVPLLEMLQSGYPTVQRNSCQCAALLASSGWWTTVVTFDFDFIDSQRKIMSQAYTEQDHYTRQYKHYKITCWCYCQCISCLQSISLVS